MTEAAPETHLFRREAVSIANDVLEAGVKLDEDRTRYAGYIESEGGLNLKTRTGLYCGQLGVAVFLAATYAVTNGERYRERAASIVAHLMEGTPQDIVDTPYVGVGNGVGSVLYGLTLLGDLTGEERYHLRAREFARAIPMSRIANDDQHDILLGTAGTITGLLAHHERSGDEAALETASLCGEHLLENRYEKWGHYRLWDTSMKGDVLSTSTGMGHGVAGIAQALYRLYGQTDHEPFRKAAAEAIRFENLFYSEYEGNWKANFGGVEHYTNWWCNGLVGVGSARLGSLTYHESELLRGDLRQVAKEFEPELLRNDSLCHGTFGQVDLLLELDKECEGDWIERARMLASQAIERRKEAGHYAVANGGVESLTNPVLFLGIAGIGYSLLRLLAPDRVPSVLRFE